MSLRPAPTSIALSLLVLVACSPSDPGGTGFGNTNLTGVTSVGMTATTGVPTTSATDGTGGTDATDGTSGTGQLPTTSATSGASAATMPNPDGLPNGAECMSPAQCMTGNCYKITIPVDGLPPGICSQCDADADCVAAGAGISCSVDANTLGGVCTDGGLGSYCETQAACQDQFYCDPIIDGAEGLLPNACNECRVDGDCTAPKRCVPAIDILGYSGQKSCVAPGTIPNDGLCPLTNGGPICLTGICNILDVGGLIDVGVCGQCAADADCVQMGLTTCTPSKFDTGFFGSECV